MLHNNVKNQSFNFGKTTVELTCSSLEFRVIQHVKQYIIYDDMNSLLTHLVIESVIHVAKKQLLPII